MLNKDTVSSRELLRRLSSRARRRCDVERAQAAGLGAERNALAHGALRMLLRASQNGAILAPPMPAHYIKPQSVDDLVDHHVGRVLDLFDIDPGLVKRWQGTQG